MPLTPALLLVQGVFSAALLTRQGTCLAAVAVIEQSSCGHVAAAAVDSLVSLVKLRGSVHWTDSCRFNHPPRC